MAKTTVSKQSSPQTKKRIYCDSCFFIAIFNNELDRCGTCKQIIADAQSGRIQIVTSALTLAECVRPACDTTPNLKQGEDDLIPEFFDYDFIEMVNVDYLIAYHARKLQIGIPKAIKPYDAIHLATATTEGVDMMFTYDDKLIRLHQHDELNNLTVCFPCRPWDSQLSMISLEHHDAPEIPEESEEELEDYDTE
jgi:predicted nucleic acid-binding protein